MAYRHGLLLEHLYVSPAQNLFLTDYTENGTINRPLFSTVRCPIGEVLGYFAFNTFLISFFITDQITGYGHSPEDLFSNQWFAETTADSHVHTS